MELISFNKWSLNNDILHTDSVKKESKDKEEYEESNYDEKLFNDISTFFTSYSWGPLEYYKEKPAREQLSPEFVQNRQYLLMVMIMCTLAALSCVVLLHCAKGALKNWKYAVTKLRNVSKLPLFQGQR
ncbi:hypothetical protein AB6A40_001331 [Gnathostoma spinigerum]|uniref:Uncharacterized protein n=1 Tax=Gnathostoma spinigerum TaxID=75299 RepID=A0ABD6E615_9BILA